ncbi:MAG TPA: methyltransferase domain-containing protein, partial [Candidatus Lokiarchaeia archaeon]
MAITYMRKLEQEPETYDSEFTTLTKGINLQVKNWILERISTSDSILEIGCGTGALSKEMALKGNKVIAIDKEYKMINFAMKNYPKDREVDLLYQIGTFTDFNVESRSKDLMISTFLLSELGPLEQQLFLRFAWKALKTNGRLLLAEEFIPSGFWKYNFKMKRWRYKKKLHRLRLKETFLVKWFFNYLEPIGFKLTEKKKWKHGAIQALELRKINDSDNEQNEPGYYLPKPKRFKGLRSQLRIYRCLFTGQIDRVPIEPGIYISGKPSKESPIIVTANYEFTYIKVMRNLKGRDAWVLCVDSRGINVWCAARGNDFGNKQLIEAVESTGIQNYSNSKTLVLPQLAAGGVAIPQLPKTFPYKIKYGPIWSKDLPKYLEDQPKKKPDSMKIARFSIFHRFRAGITHITFLFRKIFIYPILGLIILFLALGWFDKLVWLGEIVALIVLINVVIFVLFPLSFFTRKFIYKGLFFGIINILLFGYFILLIHDSIIYTLLNLPFIFWTTFFSTMSFSGYTM